MLLVFMLHPFPIKQLFIKASLPAFNFVDISLILVIKKLYLLSDLIHSRFATNTFPSWKLAQPFRYIAHNGEINTLQGNLNWLRTSEKGFVSQFFTKEEMDMLLPVVEQGQSDSASLDNMIELLTLMRSLSSTCNDDADS